MRFLIPVIVVAVVAVAVVVVVWMTTRTPDARRAKQELVHTREELTRYEEFVASLYALAIQNQDIDYFAQTVTAQVRAFHTNPSPRKVIR
ncbi:hypothetical protein [Streptosporangium lutulentum]|uniref:LemA family protein n=1 Tax=Streptosporangium lutulentum TaxID=1461250 RepID=A0ABT9QBL1_9ACTN|nr:hypothetical protein [Streptosporangium lutulentum]MDP9843309.1 hypothetical protein [Streptosporangium lutulentum]